ncbi:hypothetical protein [Dokdonella sp.]|uniref:hypothetical protein n=1 Tax=Dokdonella sp. TaxID=2291710 RepID=UPI0037830066
MNPVRVVLATLLATWAALAHAGEARGTLTLAGTTVELKAATALTIQSGGEPITLVLLSEKPIDLKAALATDDPYLTLINDPVLDGVTHAAVFVSSKRTSINAHKAGDSTQYLASRKFGLDATVSGGDGTPVKGRLRSTDKEMSVQIDAEFSTDIAKPGA